MRLETIDEEESRGQPRERKEKKRGEEKGRGEEHLRENTAWIRRTHTRPKAGRETSGSVGDGAATEVEAEGEEEEEELVPGVEGVKVIVW